jgi:hypothetical protein
MWDTAAFKTERKKKKWNRRGKDGTHVVSKWNNRRCDMDPTVEMKQYKGGNGLVGAR